MKNLKLLTLALFALLLAACGGGGGGGGNPANPIPDDAAEFSTAGFTAAGATTIDNAVDNIPNFGSITQSSNGSGGRTTDSFSMASYTDTRTDTGGFLFSKTNSVDPSKSWEEKTLDIINGNRNNGSGYLYFTWNTEIPFSGVTMFLENDILISRIRGNQFAYIDFNGELNEEGDEVIGGFWNVLTDHDNKLSGILDGYRAHVNVSTFVIDNDAVDLDCTSPCRISSGEAGAFVDGTEWNGTLPVSGSATYNGQYDALEAYDSAAPDFPFDYTTHPNGGFATVMVTFGGSNSTSIEGMLGDELTLSATPWNPNLGSHGAFYGEDTIDCSDSAALCESVSSSIFAAQFFGTNDFNDGNPSLIGGTYSVDDLQQLGYHDDNGNFVETPLRKDVIGGFTGSKQ